MARPIFELKMNCRFCAFDIARFWPRDGRINSVLLLIGTRQACWLIWVDALINFSYPFVFIPRDPGSLLQVLGLFLRVVSGAIEISLVQLGFLFIKVREVFPLRRGLDESAVKWLQCRLQGSDRGLGRAEKCWALGGVSLWLLEGGDQAWAGVRPLGARWRDRLAGSTEPRSTWWFCVSSFFPVTVTFWVARLADWCLTQPIVYLWFAFCN